MAHCVENSPVLRNSDIDDNDILDELMSIGIVHTDKNVERNIETTKDSINVSYQSICDLTDVDSFNVDSSYDADLSSLNDSNLIKVGVEFETSPSLSFKNNLETPILSTNANDSITSIPNVTLDISDEIPIEIPIEFHSNIVADGINDFKDYLKSTIDKLYETIDFLKQELEEKNILIRALTLRDGNGDRFINEFPDEPILNNSNFSDAQVAQNLHIVDYDDTSGSTVMNSTISDSTSFMRSTDDENTCVKYEEKIPWEKHSSGFASKMLSKYGYKGNGLGKFENGITEPIKVNKSRILGVPEIPGMKEQKKRKLIYIVSDSMLNQIDETRLSKEVDVKVRCHGGCTIQCMYTHMAEIINAKPEYILLHIGTNDCKTKTSDVVIQELNKLTKYIKIVLPSSQLIISLPTMRFDNKVPKAIVSMVNFKLLKEANYYFLDNSNITEEHIGKKGLHFNAQGVKIMAKNIISLIRKL